MIKKLFIIMICVILCGMTCIAQEFLKDRYSYFTIDNDLNKFNNIEPIEVIDQKQTNDCGSGCPFFDYLWIAQSFIPELDTITKVELKLFKAGNPTNTVIVSIRSSLTEIDLTSISIDASDITSHAKWIEFDFPDIFINPGETYYIVGRTPGGSSINYYCCMFDINDPYNSGTVWGSLNYGNSWDIIDYPGYPDPDGCFRTYGLDEPPNIPNINGPINGKVKISLTYKLSSTDPENDNVYYYMDWGDGTNSGWVGPYDPSLEISMFHQWNEENSYTIKALAKDIHGAVSDWGTLDIKIPRNKIINNFSLEGFFQNHPNLFSFLQKLINKIGQ